MKKKYRKWQEIRAERFTPEQRAAGDKRIAETLRGLKKKARRPSDSVLLQRGVAQMKLAVEAYERGDRVTMLRHFVRAEGVIAELRDRAEEKK